jgi:hypothetical protein
MSNSSYTLKVVGSRLFTFAAVAGMTMTASPVSSFAQVAGPDAPQETPITEVILAQDSEELVAADAEVETPAADLKEIESDMPLIVAEIEEVTPPTDELKQTNLEDQLKEEPAAIIMSAVSAIPACEIGGNLLENPSFESPVVTNDSSYQMFSTVSNWFIKKVSDATPTVLEIHKGWSGNQAAQGEQYAELDANESTVITQSVSTTPGATYSLSWAFAGRHDIDGAQNKLSIKADGIEVGTEGSITGEAEMRTADWIRSTVEFVATASTTEIAFADAGASDSYGTFLDDTQLCLVKEPVIIVTPVVPACEINVISNDTNLVGGENAVAAYALNPGWLVKNLPSSLAEWIWGTYKVTDSKVDEEQTFVKTFNWNGTVTSAILDIAADNSYVVKLNGTVIGFDASEKNFLTADQITIATSSILSGENKLEITVKNFGLTNSSSESNPAGLIYNLNIVGNNEVLNCDAGPVTPVTPTTPEEEEEEVEEVVEEEEVEEVEVAESVVVTEENTRRSGGGGTRVVRPEAQVMGVTDTVLPAPMVLGEQVSIVPIGAPDAGHGGSANQTSLTISQLILAPKRLQLIN